MVEAGIPLLESSISDDLGDTVLRGSRGLPLIFPAE